MSYSIASETERDFSLNDHESVDPRVDAHSAGTGPVADPTPDVSVIIPSYNSEATIGLCLDSVLSQSFEGESEVILVDSSKDATPAIVRERYPGIRYVHFEDKTDPGTARNFGVGLARGSILAFIDSDCIARPEWLSRLVNLHRRYEYGVIGGAVENANPTSLISLTGYIGEFSDCLPSRAAGETAHLPTCNISYKRRIFEEYGGYDCRYYPQEDYYFHWRLGKAGESIYFCPSVRVAHYHRIRWSSFFSHNRKIGEITSRVLRITDLPGSSIVRRPLLALLIIPFLPLVKFVRTALRFFRYEPRTLLRRPWSLLVLFVGLMVWARGFVTGVFSQQGEET